MLSEKLTVIIPTYNRVNSLKLTLISLCQYNRDNIEIIVLDNNSNDDTQKVVTEMQAHYHFIKYQRNKVNIGLNANLLRTIEICETEWLWMLGDDDFIIENCFEIIQTNISKLTDTVLINFAEVNFIQRANEISTKGLEQFLCFLDSFPNALFISTNIFNASKLKEYLSLGFQYSYSMIPCFIMVMANLKREDSKVIFSEKSIVKFKNPENTEKWSYLNLWLGLPTSYEAFTDLNKNEKELLDNKIFCEVKLSFNLFYNIFQLYKCNLTLAKYISRQIISRNQSFSSSSKVKILLFFLVVESKIFRHLLFRFGRFSERHEINKLNNRVI